MKCASMRIDIGRDSSLVGRLDFKSSKGRQSVLGGFDSHSLPPPIPQFGLVP
jgi:selenocysteine-specific elongation factor